MNAQHTPGPWFDWVEYRDRHGRSVVAYRDENGAIVSVLNCENRAANAALIAAAPELVEALSLYIKLDNDHRAGCQSLTWMSTTWTATRKPTKRRSYERQSPQD